MTLLAISETKEPMPSANHPVFVKPEPSTAIWRYMDFTKFVSLLESRALFFPRADLMGDPFEGSFPKANISHRKAFWSGLKLDEENYVKEQEFFRSWTFVSCWHMNTHESAGMWRLYAQTSEAIAIRTTVAKLDEQLDEETMLGKVSYIDFDCARIEDGNFFYSFLHKRLSFSHENELRAIKWRPPMTPGGLSDLKKPSVPGMRHPIDLERLLDAIYVAPTCATWFKQLVMDVVKRYGLTTEVRQSALDSKPLF
ncbi:UNVERIFIED_ORG: hypothetical protein J2W38_007054 [Variovorax paradoxus]|nr:hypothetical protein [Variovorax paradoxus]